MELRMRWTMQVCTIVGGNPAAIASGNPFRPSTMAIRMSSTPRFLSSVMTRNQNLAPSEVSIQRPRMSLVPSGVTPSRDIDGLVANEPLVADFDPQRVEENQRIHRFQRPVLPFGHRLQNRVGHRRNEIGRDLQAIKLEQMPLDLANGH